MEKPSVMTSDEALRLATLRALDIIERPLSPPLVSLLEAAKTLLDVHSAAIVYIDAHMAHLKGPIRPDIPRQIPRPLSFGTAILEADDVLWVEDAQADPKLASLRVRDPRFLAGCPLRAPNGRSLGAFLVAAESPRKPDAAQERALRRLGSAIEGLVVHQVIDDVLRRCGRAARDGEQSVDLRDHRLRLALGDEPAPVTATDPGRGSSSAWSAYDPDLLRLLLKKNSVEVLQHLLEHPFARFRDLMKSIEGINQRTLSTRLAELRARQLIVRHAHDESPPRVEYDIAPDARELVEEALRFVRPAEDDFAL